MSWDILELGEVIHVKHGYAFKSQFFSDSGKYILLSPGNCHETGGLKLKGEKEKYYTGDFPDEFLLNQGDLLVVMTDLINTAPILGGSFTIPEDDRFLHNQRLGLVQIKDEKKIDKAFLYFLLNTHEYRAQIRGSASGATVRHTAPERIYRAKLRVPSLLEVQRKIAAILSAYDDLIENNLKRITLLEEAARQLYKEWFVRLRFPGHEHTRIVDGVPEGWSKKEIRQLCQEIRNTISPNKVAPDLPYIGLEHLPRRSITLSDWGMASDVQSTKHQFCTGDILFGKIRPYFHKVGVCFTNGVASSDAIVIRPNDQDVYGLVLMTVSSDLFVAHATQSSNGTKMPRANWKVLEKYLVSVPPEGMLKELSQSVQIITAQLRVLVMQNRTLKQARDLLLPRLMSGEIPV